MSSTNPLRIAKRKLQPYDPLPGGNSYEDDFDVEKRELDDLDYASQSPHSSPSTYSSRASSAAHQPILRGRSNSRNRKRSYTASAYQHRIGRRRFTRWFALGLGGTVVLFILLLGGLGRRSHVAVEMGLQKAPPPPAVWESFPFLKRYHGGIRTLVPVAENIPEYPGEGFNASEIIMKTDEKAVRRAEDSGEEPKKIPMDSQVFNPYPNFADPEYQQQYGYVQECFLDAAKTLRLPRTRVYPGVVKGHPDNVMGSYEMFDLRDDVCFERFGRLGPYGLGYSRKFGGTGAAMEGDREGAELVWKDDDQVDFRNINWADVQERCLKDNRHRFEAVPPKEQGSHFDMNKIEVQHSAPEQVKRLEAREAQLGEAGGSTTKPLPPAILLPRTAVVIRTWHDFEYTDEAVLYLRALIAELSIHSGAEYTVHFLIHVKDDNLPIWSDSESYERVLNDSLPLEFRGMGTLWTERQMGLVYGGIAESNYRDLPVHGAYRSTFMPMQYFAHKHPEYEFFWQWEMDVRYTGHFYHLFDKVGKWAKKQPRKGLWERNSRFYVPNEHGSWDDFRHMVRVQTEHGTASKSNIWSDMALNNANVPDEVKAQAIPKPETPIWGPEPPIDDELETDTDPVPPTSYAEDKYTWGVGEDADLITFNPLFDPSGTNWILADDVTGYNTTRSLPPRRTAIITAGRLSRKLLETMHRETALRRHSMFSEMWPASCALHHGLKAVYAPHPVYIDRRWPTDYLAATMNGGRNGASGGARLSVFSDERQHNFKGTTWYYEAGFAPNLWKRWLGYMVDNDGGEEEEVLGEGRMCLRGLLLHPVKRIDLVFEHEEGEGAAIT
ncbi:hypothetical protein K490DRAFT_44906 [Saccharata proteae CBS 121410]|uniref:Uncharacterized protein n=1 Tax=Saccharata proteae CBS 121410 TaxID=1314787 RepID=A0A9P4HTI8_9PEZI|nr:hypothetical protein K490DRAFT_44906 [Saccharata proteae CBS 121410]